MQIFYQKDTIHQAFINMKAIQMWLRKRQWDVYLYLPVALLKKH